MEAGAAEPPQCDLPSTSPTRKNLFKSIVSHELAASTSRGFMQGVYSREALVRRLELSSTLKEHRGCVNSVNWSDDGEWLVSGSDDTRVCIWDYHGRKLRGAIETGHTANIFCTRFMPATDNRHIVSCAGDRLIKYMVINEGGAPNFAGRVARTYNCHQDRTKKLGTEPLSPSFVLSASEDGTIRQFDLREPHSCSGDGCNATLLVDFRRGISTFELYTLAVNQADPNYFVCAGQDPMIRLFDRRMLSPGSHNAGVRPQAVKRFCPRKYEGGAQRTLFSRGHITGVAYSHDGREVLGNYSGDAVYMFDVRDSPDSPRPDPHGPQPEAPKRKSRTEPPSTSPKRHASQEPTSPRRRGRASRPGRVSAGAAASASLSDSASGSASESESGKMEVDTSAARAAETAADGSSQERSGDAVAERPIGPSKDEFLAHRGARLAPRQAGSTGDPVESMGADDTPPTSDAGLGRGAADPAAADAAAMDSVDAASTAATGDAPSSDLDLDEDLPDRPPDPDADDDRAERTEDRDPYDLTISTDDLELPFDFGDEADARPTDRGRRPRNEDSDSDDEPDDGGAETRSDDADGTGSAGRPADADETMGGDEDDDDDDDDELERLLGSDPDSDTDTPADTQTQDDHAGDDQPPTASEPGLPDNSYAARFTGHCNIRTVKEVNFFGAHSEYVMSGSDDGNIFIWHKRSGEVVQLLAGDESVVNCITGHPYDCVLASSGIEKTVKLWTPTAEAPNPLTNLARIIDRNTDRSASRAHQYAVPLSVVRRMIRARERQAGEGGSDSDDNEEEAVCALQ